MLTRRQIATASGVIGIGLVSQAATCTGPDLSDLEKKLADVITRVQAAVKQVCSLVPTATSVVEVLLALVGTSNPDIAALAGLAQQAIETIAKACPVPNSLKSTAPVAGKTVDISFY